jgi:malonyl-CoA/methylmalonyl-CoA synthetase
VVAVVVPEQGAQLSEDQLRAGLTGVLASFKRPKRVVFVDDLPRNTMGKVQKKLLRETWSGLFSAQV